MGLFFSLPFIGYVIGWFFVGVFLTAPIASDLFQNKIGYQIGLFMAGLIGLIAVALVARLEIRINSGFQGFAPKLAVSFVGLIIGVSLGFSLPFLNLLYFTAHLP